MNDELTYEMVKEAAKIVADREEHRGFGFGRQMNNVPVSYLGGYGDFDYNSAVRSWGFGSDAPPEFKSGLTKTKKLAKQMLK